MPRETRKRSKSGVYHVMLRSVNQQQIFEVISEDREPSPVFTVFMSSWSDGEYKFALHAFGDISKEELLKMAKSLKIDN